MTSIEAEEDLPNSMKNLFTLLSGNVNLKSKQVIATELDKNSKQLKNGLLYYQNHNPNKDSLPALLKNESNISAEKLSKMSLFLDLNSEQTIELFSSYCIYEFKGTPEMVKPFFNNDIRFKQLLSDLNQYYYSERLFSLFCLKQLLSNWKKTSDHVYRQIFSDFLDKIRAYNDLLPILINQLIKLNDSPVPSRLTNGPYYTETLAKDWVNNNLKEQTEILELLLLYLKEIEFPFDAIIQLLNIFRSNGFGQKFTNFNRNDCLFVGEHVFQFIGFLQSLIIVETLDLKWLYECQQQDIECQLMKTDNSKQVKQLETIILNLSAGVVEHSPIFISWMIVRSWELPDFDINNSSSIVSQLGANALQLNVFSYFEKCLLLPQMTSLNGTVISDLIHGSIADILVVTFNVYNIEMLDQSIPALNQLCIKLFQNNFVANDLFKNGLDSGLGLIISVALKDFPFKVNPVFSFCQSLSKTQNCKQLFERLSILSNLTSYTEPFDSSLTNFMPTEEESTFVLIRDKMLFRNNDLIIKKGTKGILKTVSNCRVIEWTDININGWKLIYHRLREQFDLISRGQLHSLSEVALLEMCQIAKICTNLIQHKSHLHISFFKQVFETCIETFDMFSSLDRPFRLYMASALELSAAMIAFNPLNATTIWNKITAKQFIPYMIGLTSDVNQLISGNDTNISTLGQLIASEECLKGTYDLCLAFLNLIREVINVSELKENNDLMASLIFIIKEIFPSHYFWNFREQFQFHRIGRLCFDIFHDILVKTDKTSNRTKTEQIIINSLMEGKAAQTLLEVIKSGEITVRNVILSSGNDNCLIINDKELINEQIAIIRQSLSTLNLLLQLYNPSNCSETSNVVSMALFSSQSKPNMLLIISHYVFQRYDTHLATLAVQLLTELAKRFPMSMLACLGSDAESMREHFLLRLEQITEDMSLKMALLNFLSACVERQPGLMEMFLNVDNHINDKTTGCLLTVLEILEEKRHKKYFIPFELHLSALKFLYTFWAGRSTLGPHQLAIDSLKKTSNFWTLLTFPLFEEPDLDDILCVFILRIIAREVFYIKSLDRDKFDTDLENKFKTMRETDRLIRLSKHIRDILVSEDDISPNSTLLLRSWKDFIASITRFNPFDITDDMKVKFTNDIIDGLLNQLERTQTNNIVVTTLSDILLMLFVNWKQTCIDSEEDWNIKIENLFKHTENRKELLPFYVLHSIETSIIQYLQIVTKDFNSCDWIAYSSELLNQSLRIIEKQIRKSSNSLETEFRLSVISLSLLQTLIHRNSSRSLIWIQSLRSHFIIESLTNLLNHLNDKRIGLELAVHIILFLVELSSIEASAEVLYLIGFVDNLCISLQNTYNPISDSVLKSKFNSSLNWMDVFHLSIQMIINIVKHLKHHFVETAITFVAIHLDHMTDVLTKLRTNPKIHELSESLLIVNLCHSLSHYHQIWRTGHPISFQRFQEEILKTSDSVIAFLIRPNYLSYLMDNPDPSKAPIPLDMTPKKISPTAAFESKNLRKSVSWEPESGNHSVDPSVLELLYSFQAFSIAFLQNISQNILHLLEKQGIPNGWNLIISSSFSSPNVDPNLSLSFGSLINCIHMCIKTLNRTDKSDVSPNQKITSLLVFIFEQSLSFMVSQAMVAQMSEAITDGDKQKIIREIKSELSTIKTNVSPRQSKRLSHSSILSTPRTQSITSSLIERNFVKFLFQFVDKMSQ